MALTSLDDHLRSEHHFVRLPQGWTRRGIHKAFHDADHDASVLSAQTLAAVRFAEGDNEDCA